MVSLRPFLRRVRLAYIAPWLRSQPPGSLAGRWAQRVYDESLNPSGATGYLRLKASIFKRLARLISRLGDPLVTRQVGGAALSLP